MKIRILIDEKHEPDQVTLVTSRMTDEIKQLVRDFNSRILIASDRGNEFPLNLDDVLFFDTGDAIVHAHLVHTSYPTKYRLYELEALLPSNFIRVSKSSIVNIKKIKSIQRGISSIREIEFHSSQKSVYISRKYYPLFKDKMEERAI